MNFQSKIQLSHCTVIKYALREARSVLSRDVASGTSLLVVDKAGNITGMMLGRPVSRYEKTWNTDTIR